jgi:hypothetical protein
MCEAFRIIATVLVPRQTNVVVGKLKCQRIPALTVPPLRYALPLQDDVFAAALTQAVAHDESRLATADHHYVVAFPHRIDRYGLAD